MDVTIKRDSARDYLVIVPTMASDPSLIQAIGRLVDQCNGTRTLIVLSCNAAPSKTVDIVLGEFDRMRGMLPDGVEMKIIYTQRGIGFAEACNAGLRAAMEGDGIPKTTVFLNDDALVTAGWLHGLRGALDSETVRLIGEPNPIDRPASMHGRIGMAGPCSNEVAGEQQIRLPASELAGGIDAYAFRHRKVNTGNVIAVDFLSGFCLAVDRRCLAELMISTSTGPGFFDADTFKIGGFEDNDVCVRAELAGWRCVVAADIYVHHLGSKTLSKYPAQLRGLANRVAYYKKWRNYTQREGQRVVAVYRVRMATAFDFELLAASLKRTAQLVDAIAVLVTGKIEFDAKIEGHPFKVDVQPAPWNSPEGWLAIVRKMVGNDAIQIAVDYAPVELDRSNERDERNEVIRLAVETCNPDWLWAIDHDEVVEDRIGRPHIERLIRHPDPMVRAWDFGWLNHWDSPRLMRIDQPWSDGGSYAGGMRGFRLWRVSNQEHHRKILAGTDRGLHCGNSPDHDNLSKRVSGIRFRHYGYLRDEDRRRKHHLYTDLLDPNPDPQLTGGGYGHLVREEAMTLSPYKPNNGIGIHFLIHPGEHPEMVARWLDQFHGLADMIIPVWTDEDPIAEDTLCGPIGTRAAMMPILQAFWVDEADPIVANLPLDQHFARARNAGIDILQDSAEKKGMGWAFFFDPDEWMPNPFAVAGSLRRMAECTDSWGFMVRIENVQADGDVVPSESIRLSKLDPAMRLDGRVHEQFGEAFDRFHALGIHPQVRVAPWKLHNPGLSGSPEEIRAKLHRYEAALIREVSERPWNAGAWASIGLQRMNDGDVDGAVQCMERAVLFAGKRYLPFQELARIHMRKAISLFLQARERLAVGHPARNEIEKVMPMLQAFCPPQKILGSPREEPAPEIPSVPDEVIKLAIEANEATIGREELFVSVLMDKMIGAGLIG